MPKNLIWAPILKCSTRRNFLRPLLLSTPNLPLRSVKHVKLCQAILLLARLIAILNIVTAHDTLPVFISPKRPGTHKHGRRTRSCLYTTPAKLSRLHRQHQNSSIIHIHAPGRLRSRNTHVFVVV